MRKLIDRAQRYLHFRLSGELSSQIKDMKECLEYVENNSFSDDDFWLSWYMDHLRRYLPLCIRSAQLSYVIPRRYMAAILKPICRDTLRRIAENDMFKFKEITLPKFVNPGDVWMFFMFMSESLCGYFLDGLDEEMCYKIVSSISDGPYEYGSVRLEKGDIVIDAGANVGEFSALAGVKGCKAYAFEPIPSVIDTYLSKTAELNPNITICPYALADKQGELIFEESLHHLGTSSYVISNGASNKIKVEATDLDSFVHQNNLQSVDFLKADIEGAERYMLMGAKGVLKDFAPKISICTYHLPDDPKVLRGLILDANPNYIIEQKRMKMYAHVPS